MAANGLSPDEYRWRWKFRVRQLFNLVSPDDGAGNREDLTDAQIAAYVAQNTRIEEDLVPRANAGRTVNKLNTKVNALRDALGIDVPIGDMEDVIPIPAPAKQNTELDAIFPGNKMPTRAQLNAARGRVPGVPGGPRAPVGRPQLPMPAPPAVPLPTEPNDNIVLSPDAPTIYEAIKDANIRAINAELKSPAFNPEQTFSVTITPSGGDAITVPLTPIQYAALAGLKGVVRLLLKQNVDILKRINGKPILQAVQEYRKNDEDKAAVVYIFMIVNRATQDATEDYSSGVSLDKKYGDGLTKDVDKSLAKLVYEREYKELETPTQPLPTAVKTTSVKVEDAKKKGKEDAEKKEPRDSAYAEGSVTRTAQEIAAYNAEYTKVRVGKDGIVGKEDGEKGYPINPEYVAGSTTKTEEERKAYGEEYDKARAKYQGEKDALLNEESKFTILESQLSTAYTSDTANPEHKKAVKKLYDNAYEANRGKTADLVKEAGYVGAYPPSETVLSGNFFGFGSDLNKLIGFDTPGQQPVTDTYSKYKEGLVEFVKNLQSIIGQSKYAGYIDGLKKLPKYTTPGRISVKGKEYAIDFGKLNTQLATLPEIANGALKETAEFTSAQTILNELKRMRDDSTQTLEEMVAYLRTQSNVDLNDKIKQILKPIVVSQFGGAGGIRIKGQPKRDAAPAAPAVKTGEELRRQWIAAADREAAEAPPAEVPAGPPELGLPEEVPVPEVPAVVPEEVPPPEEEALPAAPTLLSKARTAIGAVSGKIASVPGQIVTGLGAVTTKTQLYDLIKQAFSAIPKYVEKSVGEIPKGVSPDDPSLGSDVHPLKRVQAVYDREFERGTKEGLKKGGTRRKTKKSSRLTKKQKSKK